MTQTSNSWIARKIGHAPGGNEGWMILREGTQIATIYRLTTTFSDGTMVVDWSFLVNNKPLFEHEINSNAAHLFSRCVEIQDVLPIFKRNYLVVEDLLYQKAGGFD